MGQAFQVGKALTFAGLGVLEAKAPDLALHLVLGPHPQHKGLVVPFLPFHVPRVETERKPNVNWHSRVA